MKAKWVRKKIGLIAIVFAFYGFFYLLGGGIIFGILTPNWLIPRWLELPNEYNAQLAMDSKGNLYVASQHTSRVQVYDRDGHFQRGWFVRSGTYSYTIAVDKEDKIFICNINNNVYFYNQQGRLLERFYNKSVEFCFDIKGFLECDNEGKPGCKVSIDKEGNKYVRVGTPFLPNIYKISPAEERTLLISQRPVWFFFSAQGALMLFLVFGFFYVLCAVEVGYASQKKLEQDEEKKKMEKIYGKFYDWVEPLIDEDEKDKIGLIEKRKKQSKEERIKSIVAILFLLFCFMFLTGGIFECF